MKEFVNQGRAVRRQYITALLNAEYSVSYHVTNLSLRRESKNLVVIVQM